MAAQRAPQPKCKHCGHPFTRHVTSGLGLCAKRVPVAWKGTGRNKQPIIGYCKCPGYEPEESE